MSRRPGSRLSEKVFRTGEKSGVLERTDPRTNTYKQDTRKLCRVSRD